MYIFQLHTKGFSERDNIESRYHKFRYLMSLM